MTCEQCGATLTIGEFPFCPHGTLNGPLGVIGDEYVGGFTQENFGDKPEVFYSKKQMFQRADELGLRHTDRFPSWRGAIDAKTLDNARVLLSRGTQTSEQIRCETASFTVREVKVTHASNR